MKFFPEKPKKIIFSFIIIGACLAGIVYFLFFSGRPSAGPLADSVLPEGGAAAPTLIKPQGLLLPYGSDIDIGLFDEDKFRSLRSVPPLGISDEELGKTDLFLE